MTDPGPAGSPLHAVPPGSGGPAGTPGPHGVSAPPPPGPGVAPPFAAPPTEGRTTRIWLGIGAAALGVLLCCGGGTAAVIGLGVAATQAVKEQARAVVGDYLDAVTDREYGKAYGLLCDAIQRQETPNEFRQRVSAEPRITDYQVGDVRLTDRVTVPVDVTYVGGTTDLLRFQLEQDNKTGEMEVCGIN
ncbi:MAG TPA: hypothetical protein VFX60_11070 [Micromonospora sp.]|nr:hypothetical protein [Micromonospora sp.]